jgi:hypothetical protein
VNCFEFYLLADRSMATKHFLPEVPPAVHCSLSIKIRIWHHQHFYWHPSCMSILIVCMTLDTVLHIVNFSILYSDWWLVTLSKTLSLCWISYYVYVIAWHVKITSVSSRWVIKSYVVHLRIRNRIFIFTYIVHLKCT